MLHERVIGAAAATLSKDGSTEVGCVCPISWIPNPTHSTPASSFTSMRCGTLRCRAVRRDSATQRNAPHLMWTNLPSHVIGLNLAWPRRRTATCIGVVAPGSLEIVSSRLVSCSPSAVCRCQLESRVGVRGVNFSWTLRGNYMRALWGP